MLGSFWVLVLKVWGLGLTINDYAFLDKFIGIIKNELGIYSFMRITTSLIAKSSSSRSEVFKGLTP